ncbi:MAG: hypothetical protein ACRD3J_06055, partial [Thermoanaerobaculia bacterium]
RWAEPSWMGGQRQILSTAQASCNHTSPTGNPETSQPPECGLDIDTSAPARYSPGSMNAPRKLWWFRRR